MPEAKKRALIHRDFTDSGTGESFAKGDTPMLTLGQHANYEAAGLIGTPPPVEKSPAKPKSKSKPRAAKRPAPVKTETPAPPAAEVLGDATSEA